MWTFVVERRQFPPIVPENYNISCEKFDKQRSFADCVAPADCVPEIIEHYYCLVVNLREKIDVLLTGCARLDLKRNQRSMVYGLGQVISLLLDATTKEC
jgi:hypothetical protein